MQEPVLSKPLQRVREAARKSDSAPVPGHTDTGYLKSEQLIATWPGRPAVKLSMTSVFGCSQHRHGHFAIDRIYLCTAQSKTVK
jgi:hypothetical protein